MSPYKPSVPIRVFAVLMVLLIAASAMGSFQSLALDWARLIGGVGFVIAIAVDFIRHRRQTR